MNRILGILIIFLFMCCSKSPKDIYELRPDKSFYFLKKENGDSIKTFAEPFLLDYSKPKFLKISRYNSNSKKFELEMTLLNVKGEYYNYYNLQNKDSIDEGSFVFLTKEAKVLENIIDTNPLNYWKKGTEIFKAESNGVYSRQLYFTSPKNYILDFGKYYYDEDYKILKIVETIGRDKITYE